MVNDEKDFELIPSGHGEPGAVLYRVSFLKVRWQDGLLHDVFCVFVQYGDERDFVKAKKLKQISFTRPAHVLLNDLDAVMCAIEKIKARQKG